MQWEVLGAQVMSEHAAAALQAALHSSKVTPTPKSASFVEVPTLQSGSPLASCHVNGSAGGAVNVVVVPGTTTTQALQLSAAGGASSQVAWGLPPPSFHE